MSAVSAYAPATVANLAAGFDILGLALEGPGDTVTARLSDHPGVRIAAITGDNGVLPRDAEDNTAGIAAISTLKRAGVDVGIELSLHKGLPIGSGLGSSASSAAAAAMAVNLLVGSPLRKSELIEPCLDAEAHVSGRHADNLAPALLGGLVLVRGVDPVDVVRLPIPEELVVAVVSPDFVLETKKARAVLPDEVPLSAMIRNSANLASMVAACFSGDLSLLGRSVTDEVVTPARAKLIPGCTEVIDTALSHGALGASISGAGPAVFALCRSRRSAREVGAAMQTAFAAAGLNSVLHVSKATAPGARRVSL
ncbi:MAG: homoserine kinase [Deltaproteobacteria bacterium]|nr:MAG: homoserine kinase [Deltaproteobacteria bacterium]